MKALVVFHDHGAHPLDRFLTKGFKHCFVVVPIEGHWIRVDGMAGRPVIDIEAESSYDLAAFYREQEGFSVVETEQRSQAPLFPFITANCVGLVKGLLCINAPLVITPFGLYKHLTAPDRGSLLPGKSVFSPPKPKKVAAAPPPPERDDPEVTARREELRLSELKRRGRAATILTGGANLEGIGAPLGRPAAAGSGGQLG